jgi:hypothetical protein
MKTKEGDWLINSGNLTANLQGDLSLEHIDLKASFNIKSPKITAPDGLTDWQQQLVSSINNENVISFQLTAKGSILEPNIKLDSNLERLFKKAFDKKFKQKAQALKQKVKQQLMDKIGDIKGLENFNGDFEEWKEKLLDKDKLLKDILGKVKI